MSEPFSGKTEILERAAQEYESSNPDFPIDRRRTALLAIDLQEGFVAEGARMWTPQIVYGVVIIAMLLSCGRIEQVQA